MLKMRFILKFILPIVSSLVFIQCQSDDITISPVDEPILTIVDTIYVDENISADQTWVPENLYILNDLISVTDDATLTIQAGVLVKAAKGATGLVITRGAKIDAQGTAANPIIFTALEDQLGVGDILSPNLTGSDVALWSGIFVLGNAPVSSAISPAKFSLLPNDPLFEYGGNQASDNSGFLNYVSIRHTGFQVVQDETTSGLNLGGVGNGTTISNIELFANEDDAIVLDGGTVDVENLLTTSFFDDAIDCDRGWSGTINNAIGVGAFGFDNAIEVDGGEGQANPTFTISNASFKGSQSGENYIEFRSGVNCTIEDSYFFNFDAASAVILQRDRDADNWIDQLIDVSNLQFNTSHLSSGNNSIATIFVDNGLDGIDAFQVRNPNASVVTSPSTGADKSVFATWTVGDLSGSLDDF
jgi:hypothetical protein